MNPVTLAAFRNELEKIAGTGWDIHGYHRDPKDLEVAQAWNALDRHIDGSHKLSKEQQDALVHKAMQAEEHTKGSKIPTPHDQHTNYKFNAMMSGTKDSGFKDSHWTDYAYSAKPYENRLDRDQLKEVLGHYTTSFSKNYPNPSKEEQAMHDAFMAKGKHLLEHPKFQFARLEWE